jgi:hypothetical protein
MSISTATLSTTTSGWHTVASITLSDVTAIRIEAVCKEASTDFRGYIKGGWIVNSVSTDVLDYYRFVDDETFDCRVDGTNIQVHSTSNNMEWYIRYWTLSV